MLTFAEYFAGIGLVYEGLKKSGWKPVLANDIDVKKQIIYEMNHGSDHFLLKDIYDVDPSTVPFATLATASFPCTDLSLAGARKGLEGAESSAFWGFIKILKGMKHRLPPIVMLENVPGFLTSNKGKDFLDVIHSLNELGYRCDAFQVDASYFVPQSRQRVFVIGALANLIPEMNNSSIRSTRLRPKVLEKLISDNDMNWGEFPLPELPTRLPRNSLINVLEDIPEQSELWWKGDELSKLLDQMSDKHRLIIEEMINADETTCGTVYRRMRNGQVRAELRTDGIAGALRTPRGGSSRQFVIIAGKGNCRARVLTGREYGRLQGVEDKFDLSGVSENHARFGFGDAVCVPVIEWISDHILHPLALKI
ncbi:DNA cytosine methyltransferase [Paenibacillus prosopidis]|uniref:DNA (cytosine-5-)-methyltransferase n=1 Tax=Paenibacillus prosopidis TaxID=630520 RepID=A0A368W915_9BACL|nr:DNA (cytosine-5-)-methyltransferase [Paenibacillus prosopidis]RCW52069.1 DNA (cytosine-5)-methyltransferase 1 [Paenibacillus prosopidis]